MNVLPGDLFWISPNETNQIASDHTHPHVVIECDASNVVTVCALTSNMKRAKEPGNVLLDEGEANLSRHSIVVVSQVFTVEKAHLGEHIGTLTEQRVHQVLAGMRLLQYLMQHHE
jgi:mRNA interferase MazF